MNSPVENKNEISEMLIQSLAKNWWVLLIRGILLILIGGYALSTPGLTLASYCWVLGIFVIADGIMALLSALTQKIDGRGLVLLRGVLTLLVGVFIVAHPLFFGAIVAITLLIILACHSLVSGALEIYVAIRDRKAIQGEGWMVLSGAFSILFGFVLLSAPVLSAKILIQISGIFAIIYGFAAVFAAFRFKGLK